MATRPLANQNVSSMTSASRDDCDASRDRERHRDEDREIGEVHAPTSSTRAPDRRPASAVFDVSASAAITQRPSRATEPVPAPRRCRRLPERQIASADTPRLNNWRSVPCSRSPANAENVISTMKSGSRICSTSARGHLAEALHRRPILRRPILELVLLVRLQPHGDAHVGIDAGVDDRELALRLERVHAVVRGRVRILLRPGSATARASPPGRACCRLTSA